MSRTTALLSSFLVLSTLPAGLASAVPAPDEGMWTYDNPPLALMEETYGFQPSTAWLEHLRLSSVRVNDGGSGSFISPRGLVLTNHHVGFNAIQKLSSEERDLVADGFYAAKLADELACTDLELNVLVDVVDVTERVLSAAAGAESESRALEQRDAEIARFEKEETEATGLRCDVVRLYEGGRFALHRYKKYTEVKLVFAPEEGAAFFGGDPDNFTFPRYCLDMAIFRVYEDGEPAHTPHYLRWNEAGPAEGDLVFVSGNPGSTGRLKTVAQLEYLRDVRYPSILRSLEGRKRILDAYAARGEEEARRARSLLLSAENGIKAVRGYLQSLRSEESMAVKARRELELRGLVARDAELAAAVGEAWDRIAAAQEVAREHAARAYFATIRGSRLFSHAKTVVRLTAELEKPNDERLAAYRDSNLDSLELSLYSEAPIYLDLEEALLAGGLAMMREELGDDDPLVRAVLDEAEPMNASSRALGTGSKLADAAYRRALVEGGREAVEQCDDPIVQLVRRIDPLLRELEEKLEDEVESVETEYGKQIAKARFAIFGDAIYPDATFTLRLSYGAVRGFETGGYNMPWKTTFYGLYERAAAFDGAAPYTLSDAFRAGRQGLDLSTPFNFVCTADIIGGNSGSPVVDRDGRLVGLIFDGNVQSLGNRFVYDDSVARAVAVHAGGMLEALREIYHAERLVANRPECIFTPLGMPRSGVSRPTMSARSRER